MNSIYLISRGLREKAHIKPLFYISELDEDNFTITLFNII